MSNGQDTDEEQMIGTAVKRCKLIGSIRFVKEVYRRFGVRRVLEKSRSSM